MAVHKAKRSNPLAQPRPQHAKNARAGDHRPARRRPNNPQTSNPQTNPQGKARLFDVLQHLNRGYGIALTNLNNLELMDKDARPGLFPRGCLPDLRNRTEELRAVANHQLLQTLASREERDALRFLRLRAREAFQGLKRTKSKRRTARLQRVP